MSATLQKPTVEQYAAIFEAERAKDYPVIDAFERECGYAVGMERVEAAARVLACPLKEHAPNWQHGRILYAMTRRYLATRPFEVVTALDVGTAKGFSALCLRWALNDSDRPGHVVSVDVLDPKSRQRRNSVAELDGYKTIAEFLEPWPEADRITFLKSTGLDWLERTVGRVHVAFIDGKHTGAVVFHEGKALALRQETGDVAMFDDVQIDGVDLAVRQLAKWYDVRYLAPIPDRKYAIGVRRG